MCSRECEVVSWWCNVIGNERQRWQRGEPIDDGRLARCSRAPCRRFPLERQGSQRWVQCYITRESVKTLAETLGWSLTPGREGLSGLPHHEKPTRSGFGKGWSNDPPCPRAASVAVHHCAHHKTACLLTLSPLACHEAATNEPVKRRFMQWSGRRGSNPRRPAWKADRRNNVARSLSSGSR